MNTTGTIITLAMNERLFKTIRMAVLLLSLWLGACNSRQARMEAHAGHSQGQERASAGETVRPTEQMVISSQATVKPAYAAGAVRVPVQGYITYDIRRNHQVAARAGGRVEKLYVRYNNQYVRRGDKIMDLYSPGLNTFQDELLYLLRSGAEPGLLEQGREKLRLLGLSRAQIRRLEKTGTHAHTLTIYSPYQGYIQLTPAGEQRVAASEAATGSMEAMSSASNTPVDDAAATEVLREGAYVNAGQTLFSVNDLQQVWALLSFDTRFSALVREKDAVQLESEMVAEGTLAGAVGLLEPIFRQQQKFIQARVYLPNPEGRLKLNSLVSGSIRPRSQQHLVVPASSVFDMGRRKIVWVYRGRTPQGNKRFEAREILTGAASGDSIRVIRGLAPHEQIARDAGYLVDSESFIQPSTLQP
jgi:membrane fusion protein, copper/silver efflux system